MGILTSTHNLCFEQKHEKYQNFLSDNFLSFLFFFFFFFFFFGSKFSIYLNRHLFVITWATKKSMNYIDVHCQLWGLDTLGKFVTILQGR